MQFKYIKLFMIKLNHKRLGRKNQTPKRQKIPSILDILDNGRKFFVKRYFALKNTKNNLNIIVRSWIIPGFA